MGVGETQGERGNKGYEKEKREMVEPGEFWELARGLLVSASKGRREEMQ